MKHSNSIEGQLSINLQKFGFPLGEYLTTRKLRSLIQAISGVVLTAREIEQKGKSGRFEIPWDRGVLVVTPSVQPRSNRFLRWDVHCFPSCIYQAA